MRRRGTTTRARTDATGRTAVAGVEGLPLFDAALTEAAPAGGAARDAPSDRKRAAGSMAYHGGLAAEDQVARYYADRGRRIRSRRWRGSGGEIDIVAEAGDELIFVEVKSSSTHDRAAENFPPRQFARLRTAAEEYLGDMPLGSLTPCRIDLALVDGVGRIAVVENLIA